MILVWILLIAILYAVTFVVLLAFRQATMKEYSAYTVREKREEEEWIIFSSLFWPIFLFMGAISWPFQQLHQFVFNKTKSWEKKKH